MGVRGLTTFVQAYQGSISELREYVVSQSSSSSSSTPSVTTTLAVDALAWVFEIWLTNFGDAVQGGNYQDITEHIKDVIHAWRLAHLEPVFIWDGAIPELKTQTVLSRRGSVAALNSAFMRSSPSTRASKRFQAECCSLPPLLIDCVRDVLRSLGVENIAVEAEADSAVAELAEQTGGLAVSKDSDYFILCSRGAGRARYAPLDTFEYLVEQAPVEGQEQAAEAMDDNDGFEAVSRGRRKKKAAPSPSNGSSSSRITALDQPPSRSTLLSGQLILKSIRARAFSSHALAARLKLPAPLLPLLASVVGNDYSTTKQESLLFRHISNWADRIQEAAAVIRLEWHSSLGISKRPIAHAQAHPGGLQARIAADRRRAMLAGGDDDSRSETSVASSGTATPAQLRFSDLDQSPVMDPVRALVTATLNALLKRSDTALHNAHYVTEGEKEAAVQSIIDGVAAYSLMITQRGAPNLLANPVALLHPTKARGRPADVDEAMQLYREAFSKLDFPPEHVGVMAQRVFFAVLAPEDPDLKSVHVGAARRVRQWIYAVLFDVYGMNWAREEMAEPVTEGSNEEVDDDNTADSINGSYGRGGVLGPPRYKEGEKPDDIISVDTESTLSAQANVDDDDDDDDVRSLVDENPSSPLASEAIKPPPAVREYVRKGDRYVGELVEIVDLESLLNEASASNGQLPASLTALLGQYAAAKGGVSNGHSDEEPHVDPPPPLAPLLPLHARLDLYRLALQSTDLQAGTVPLSLLPLAACVRHLVASITQEAGESKRRLNWTKAEIVSAIRAGCQALRLASEGRLVLDKEHWVSQPSVRGIHLASTLQLMLRTAHDLSRSLLLPSSGDAADLAPPHLLFDGPLFQLLLENDGNAIEAMGLSKDCKAEAASVVKAVLHGYEDDLGLDGEELKRLRREAKKARKAAGEGANGVSSQSSKQRPGQQQKNLFDLLDGGSGGPGSP
ncbi:PIN domain-like protein [Jaminaea rosea]|uniref:PIN domain-like protein n=1 Tax=Jaminaea rosea TaxID=1569628 RepID=A0A316UZC8_9BASI|nr:PIN domain-like protein [Jaminaea rosea]PWN30649.1 PIN domain-like protein [Jaminaea rosea]